jgi:hypothetical protein
VIIDSKEKEKKVYNYVKDLLKNGSVPGRDLSNIRLEGSSRNNILP